MQVAYSFDKETLKKIGVSLAKTLGSAVLVWLGSNIDAIGSAIKDPTIAVMVTLVIRSLITIADEWRKGQNAGVTLEEVDAHFKMFPDQNLDTAIGYVVGLKNGHGQERSEPFSATTDGSEVVIESTDEKLPEAEEAAT